jgi:hypothetical protein
MDTARLVWQGGIPMMRQFIRRGLILGAFVLCQTGCESLHSVVRHDDKDEVAKKDDSDDPAKPKSVGSDTSKINSVDSTDKDPQPFFKPSRARSGFTSFSPEAQQIEKDLGVY